MALLAGIALGVVAVIGRPAPQTERSRAESLSKQAATRLQQLQREADALASQERTVLNELRRLELERQMKIEQLAKIDRDAADTRAKLDEALQQISTLELRAVRQRPGLEARLIELYKLGDAGYLRLMLSVGDLRQVGRAYRMVSQLVELDRRRVVEHRQTLGSLTAARAALTKRDRELRVLAESARQAREAADRAVAARESLVAELDRRRDLNAQLTGELQQAQQRLQQAVQAMGSERQGIVPVALPIGPFRGELGWPVQGRVTARFGSERNGRLGTTIVRNGIEIDASEGTEVRVVHDGRVAFADTFVGFGNLAIVEHGDESFSLYGYLSNLAVARGDAIGRGAVVGTVGRAPAGPPTLYFELRIDGKPVDPLQWLKK
jgi:septal ring factor EnvC (AmiA/AmiB activator)